jgi:hypothetical protein
MFDISGQPRHRRGGRRVVLPRMMLPAVID